MCEPLTLLWATATRLDCCGNRLSSLPRAADARFDQCVQGIAQCGWLDLQSGIAEVGVAYEYTIYAALGLSFFSGGSPFGGVIIGEAWIDPVISIDPEAEFAPGQRYVDFVEVQVSPNVVQAIPEPATFALLGAGLVALAARRKAVEHLRRAPRRTP